MRRFAILATLLALAACNPPPRSVSDFKANPHEDAQVLAECAAGNRRGAECANAQTAAEQLRSDARLNLYKRSF